LLVGDQLPLSGQLSAAFVAFVVEADNAAEQQVSHMTTSFGAADERGAVWLASLAMWFNCVGPLADAGGELTVAELSARARMTTNLDGMRRWGYITIDGVGRVPRRAGGAGRPHPKASSVLALTDRGAAIDGLWRPLPAVIEQRWRKRLGADGIDRLRDALLAVAAVDTAAWPDLLPILHVHLGGLAEPEPRDLDSAATDEQLPLVSLLARVLLRFTLDCDRDARLPLPIWSDLVRVLDRSAARVNGPDSTTPPCLPEPTNCSPSTVPRQSRSEPWRDGCTSHRTPSTAMWPAGRRCSTSSSTSCWPRSRHLIPM
jgi:hypothetical protein